MLPVWAFILFIKLYVSRLQTFIVLSKLAEYNILLFFAQHKLIILSIF